MNVSLDRYVGRIVAGSWFASIVFFLFLSILIDLLNNVGGYLDSAEKRGLGVLGLAGLLGRYYLALMPSFFVTIAPFATVIACMFAVARLMSANELVPMLFIGRSMIRILRPVLVTGAMAALGMAACWQWLVPALRDAVQHSTSAFNERNELRGIVVPLAGETSAKRTLFVTVYQPLERTFERAMVLTEDATGDAILVDAEAGAWDEAKGDWKLVGGKRGVGDVVEPVEWLGEPSLTPFRLQKAGMETLDSEFLSYTDLVELRKLRPNRTDVTLALHRHLTYPLANIILLLLALPFAVHFERGSRLERVIGAIAICAAYLVVDLICQSLGQRDYIHPIVAAWSPTILFGSLGVVFFGSIRS